MNVKTALKALHHWLLRTRRTYSQTGEDSIADFFLSQKQGLYVDVGTNDPIYLNNTYWFYKKGWRGICIEPDSFRCGMIRTVRWRDRVVNEGIGRVAGAMDFFVFEPDTLSTFSREESERYKKLGYLYIGTRSIPVRPLCDILAEHARGVPLDLMSVDTEGYDMEVLKSNDWERFRPKLLIVEVVQHCGDRGIRQAAEFDSFLKAQSYLRLADTYLNCIYISAEYAREKQIDVV